MPLRISMVIALFVLAPGFSYSLEVKGLAAGQDHSCALFDTGQVKCWGSNASGQLGIGTSASRGQQPGEMGNNLPFINLGTGVLAEKIGAAESFTCALTTKKQVKCWGDAVGGTLGQGNGASIGTAPNQMGDNLKPIDFGVTPKIKNMFIGVFHNCVVFEDGRLKCWGYSDFGQLGYGDLNNRGDQPNEMGANLPFVDLGAGQKVVKMSGGYEHSCALFENGKIKCWGRSQFGQTGYGQSENIGDQPGEMGDKLPFVDLGTREKAVDLATGNNFSCALFENGKIKCWGQNDSGQLGLGDTASRGKAAGEMGETLSFVDLGPDQAAVSLYRGGLQFVCAKLINSSVKCWGSNISGQLGQDDNLNKGDETGETGEGLLPTYLGRHLEPDFLALGYNHTCALLSRFGKQEGVKCWGSNSDGQLGVGDNQSRGDEPGEMSALNLIELF
jgi:alpha-tubulin suppressor-like RCC1 family protein